MTIFIRILVVVMVIVCTTGCNGSGASVEKKDTNLSGNTSLSDSVLNDLKLSGSDMKNRENLSIGVSSQSSKYSNYLYIFPVNKMWRDVVGSRDVYIGILNLREGRLSLSESQIYGDYGWVSDGVFSIVCKVDPCSVTKHMLTANEFFYANREDGEIDPYKPLLIIPVN
ncbi:MAG: hypothetical protein OHK0022_16680 [Roseiflexaceae bacterium]